MSVHELIVLNRLKSVHDNGRYTHHGSSMVNRQHKRRFVFCKNHPTNTTTPGECAVATGVVSTALDMIRYYQKYGYLEPATPLKI
jgi:hypothetical protein